MEPKRERLWLSAGAVYDQAPENIDKEKGVIYGASIITLGEAKGHGFYIDEDMLDSVVRLSHESYSQTDRGLKARFGHPNLSSEALGTFLGRWRNVRREGDQVLGDFYGSSSARNTPDGDLLGYVLDLAEDDERAFGVSSVLDIGQAYTRNREGEKVLVSDELALEDGQRLYYEIDGVIAADMVDDPAANPDGLFSAWHLSSMAGQMTRFLDTHPQIFELVREKPEILQTFFDRYERYLARKGLRLGSDDAGAVLISRVGSDDADGTQKPEQGETMSEHLKALKAEWPDRPDFVLEQLEKGHDLEAARADFKALRAQELEAENEKLKARVAELEQQDAERAAEAEKLAAEAAEKAKREAEIAAAGETEGLDTTVDFQASTDSALEAEFEAKVRELANKEGIPYEQAICKAAEQNQELANKIGA